MLLLVLYGLPKQAKIQMMEEVAMRRERRLMFLTKERDGYINVLKSYQVDGSVEQQVKDLQAEVLIIKYLCYIKIVLYCFSWYNAKLPAMISLNNWRYSYMGLTV